MKKIIFDCERMKYSDTGLYHFCLQLGYRLNELVNPSSEQLFFYMPQHIRGIFGNQKKFISQNSLQKFLMPSIKEFNIWHCTFQNSNYVPFLNKKIKVVLTIHDLNFLYSSTKNDSKKRCYLNHVQSLIKRSETVICISEYCLKDVMKNFELKDKPIHMIYNGCNPLQEPKLNANSYKPVQPFLFSIGEVKPKKNFHALIPLLAKLENTELIISGRLDDTDYVQYILKTADAYAVRHRIRLTGCVSENEKSWYFNNCLAFVFPSLSEGFGLSVTEAMSVGKPIFLSEYTSLPEIGGSAAFYFADYDSESMLKVFESGMKEYESKNMHDLIIQRSHHFNWIQTAKGYLDIYRSLY